MRFYLIMLLINNYYYKEIKMILKILYRLFLKRKKKSDVTIKNIRYKIYKFT